MEDNPLNLKLVRDVLLKAGGVIEAQARKGWRGPRTASRT